MSVINKKEFFLLWTKQTVKNLQEKFDCTYENSLARDLLKDNKHFLQVRKFLEIYGCHKLNAKFLSSPSFMLDFLIVHNGKEFFPKEALDSSVSANTNTNTGEERQGL